MSLPVVLLFSFNFRIDMVKFFVLSLQASSILYAFPYPSDKVHVMNILETVMINLNFRGASGFTWYYNFLFFLLNSYWDKPYIYSYNPWKLWLRHVLFHEKNSISDISRKCVLPNMNRAESQVSWILCVASLYCPPHELDFLCFDFFCALLIYRG